MAQQLVGCHCLARQVQGSSVVETTRPWKEDWLIDKRPCDEGARRPMKKVEEKAAFCHFPSGDQKGQAHGIIEASCLESWRINEHAALRVTNMALQTLEKNP